MSQHIFRIASVVLGIVGACFVGLAAALFVLWVMDGGGFAAGWPEGLASLVLAAAGALLLWLGRVLQRVADQANVAKPTPFA